MKGTNGLETMRLAAGARFAAAVLAVTALAGGCGPSGAVLRAYVVTSPRRTVALMPVTTLNGDAALARRCDKILGDGLEARGFVVMEQAGPAPSDSVFGADTAPPTVAQAQSFGRRAGAPVVLVARIERAVKAGSRPAGTYRHVRRSRLDATGHRVYYDEDVLVGTDRPGPPAQFRIALRLLDTASGRMIWSTAVAASVPDWTLADNARYGCQTAVEQLSEAYYNRKL